MKRAYDTCMICEECSAREGKPVYLCNDRKGGTPVLCHLAYHKKYHSKKYADNK